jgi:hypothetical protein
MEVCHCRPRYIGHGALYVPQLYIIYLVDRLLHRYGATHIQLHAAAYYCSVRFNILFLNVRSGPDFWWQQLLRRGGLTGICFAAVSLPGAHWMKRPSFYLVRIESYRTQVFVEP